MRPSQDDNIPSCYRVLEKTFDRIRDFTRQAQNEIRKREESLGNLFTTVCSRVEKSFQCIKPSHTTSVAFATMTRRFEIDAPLIQRRRQIQGRMSNVPVYLVVKDNGKLIYIKPESEQRKKPIGLIFMSMQSAEQLLDKIHSDVPEFARDTNVMRLDLGHLYEIFTDQKLGHLKNVIFRFVPDKQQIINAMEILRTSGDRIRRFRGVPVFFVNGLNAGEDAQRPYFLAKEDLDYAIDVATQKKIIRDRQALRDDLEILKDEAREARFLASQAEERPQVQNWLMKANEAEIKSARLTKQIDELPETLAAPVQIEVRSLETLLCDLENAKNGQLDDIVLIPPGLARHQLFGAKHPYLAEETHLELEDGY